MLAAVSLNFQQNHFHLFNLTPCFALDAAQLDQHYRALQAQIHPDKFAHRPEAERRVSAQWATHVNAAYQTLRKPLPRARYLLQLHGIDTQEETNTAMPLEFLMQQMEWREAVVDALQARDSVALSALERSLQTESATLAQQLAVKIDTAHDYAAAAELVRKLRFLEKLAEEVMAAWDEMERV